MSKLDLFTRSLAFITMLLILMVTLSPYNFAVRETISRLGYKWLFVGVGDSSLIDMRNNILLFLPLGFSLAWLKKRVWITGWPDLAVIGLTSFALSYSIEVLQVFLYTRSSSLVDVFSNTLGGIAGYVLFVAGRCILSSYSISTNAANRKANKQTKFQDPIRQLPDQIPNPSGAGPLTGKSQ